ncbi:ABC transporter substrate-binding protein [Nisaea sediminum]|uniref:ABC transporter substrate-binding protein n=1 Tax=Nisaea sediminum TaxID=2775867 RepID=UPI001D02690D|nr:ABC transporter substrate-binding protein [Nisaea sediminum]
MFRPIFMGAAVIAVAATLFSILQPTPARAVETVTVTDTVGRTVTVPHGAERVLLGFYFEDFYAIVGPGAYQRVVAISRGTWEGWRPSQWIAYTRIEPRIETLADIGDFGAGTFNLEAALTARPDVAILAVWQYRSLGEAAQTLEKAGIPIVVVDYNAQTLEKHIASTHLIGKVMASESRADRLAAEYEAAVTDVLARVAKAEGPKKKVYVELGRKGPGEVDNSYAGGMWGGVIDIAGGDNIANDQIENWGPLNPEYVLASKPEVILLAGSSWTGLDQAVLMGFAVDPAVTKARAGAYRTRSGWSALPAVESGDLYTVYHSGARTLYDYTFLQFIAKALHPDLFADLDPEAAHRRFYREWLPVAADGTFMLKAN